jgi:ribose 1,5-bisphosphokinase PhnN
MITVKRQVKVKMILTEASRRQLEQEFNTLKNRYSLELEQLQFQAKKLLAEAQRRGHEALEVVQQRLIREENTRRDKMGQLDFQLEQLQNLPEGSEVLYTTVDSYVEIRPGDDWESLMNDTEIILEDGIVKEIRKGGGSDG